MILSFACFLTFLFAGTLGLHFLLRLRSLRAVASADVPANIEGRYLPMLRLLAEDDFATVSGNPRLARKLRAERRQLFRGYLHCLSRDYGRLMAGLRLAMAEAHTDRPELARALARNRVLFAWAICKVEMRLVLHATGIGSVDVSKLVEAVEVLRVQTAAFTALTAPSAV